VPFGKYKGQPLEILLSDTSYITYQKQQPGFMKWLEENHVTIYNIFTTGAQQVQDTPEHNKLQARFLDKKFQLAFAELASGFTIAHHCKETLKCFDASRHYSDKVNIEHKNNRINHYQSIMKDQLIAHTDVSFEHGYDVDLEIDESDGYIQYSFFKTFRIEIKPFVGDNYPAVLRQMKINQPEYSIEKCSDGEYKSTFRGIDALLIGKFESESIDIDQLRGIFGRYKVVLLSEIEEKLASYK
jgi:hypothetical protein